MNGWQTSQPTAEGERPAGGTYRQFKAAWRHLVTFMRRQGADNIKWVFNPSADVYPGTTPVGKIWPGSRYVDVLGIDGFNWVPGLRMGTMEVQPSHLYADVQPTDPARRCSSRVDLRIRLESAAGRRWFAGGPRAQQGSWLRHAFGYDGFPRVAAMVHFEVHKERDRRFGSSRSALR